MSNQVDGNVVVAAIGGSTATSDFCFSTSHLSSLFASFLTGVVAPEVLVQKYFVLYKGSPSNLGAEYEQEANILSTRPLIDRVDVRSSSTSRNEDGTYCATFLGTFQGTGLIGLNSKVSEKLSLALVAGDKVLAFTTFDEGVYRMMCEGSRVEIKWKLQLKNVPSTFLN